MTHPSPTFGRRPVRRGAAPPPPAPGGVAAPLSPEAEAFRRQLGGLPSSEFEAWRRSEQLGRWTAWAATFALLTPGVLCFLGSAPWEVSTGLEVVGIVGGVWLRRARRERLAAVRDWEPDPFASTQI